VDKGLEIMVAQSYSKNLGLYGERVGALTMVTADKEVRVFGVCVACGFSTHRR
jgi:aspartate/tyrosine/aromatic aminotransferase